MNESFGDQEKKINSRVDDEINLKDIIQKTRHLCAVVWLFRVRIIFFSLFMGSSAALFTNFAVKPNYTASYQLFFEKESGGMSSAMRLASSFGLSLGGGGSTSIVRVKEYLHSRDNISKALVTNLDIGHLVNRYYSSDLKKDTEFAADFAEKFGFNQRYTDSVKTKITRALNNGHIRTGIDKETGIISFSVNGKDENFVYHLAHLLVLNTEKVFIDLKRKKSHAGVNAFQLKVDSLELAIDAKLRRLGEYEDQNISLVSAVEKMKRMRLTIDMELLKVAYGEYIKALEMSKADLVNLEAPFTYFDVPTYPLQKEERSAAKVGIITSMITLFLFALFFMVREEVSNIITE